jgi:hypothetical protein
MINRACLIWFLKRKNMQKIYVESIKSKANNFTVLMLFGASQCKS